MGRPGMIKQYFRIADYDWNVYVYYNVSHVYAKEILALLQKVGVSEYDYTEAYYNLTSKSLDRGLCYSNFKDKTSVLVISPTSTSSQFMNSLIHEIRHLERHIEYVFGIDPFSEEAAYLAGTIAEEMFPKAKLFMCKCYGLLK